MLLHGPCNSSPAKSTKQNDYLLRAKKKSYNTEHEVPQSGDTAANDTVLINAISISLLERNLCIHEPQPNICRELHKKRSRLYNTDLKSNSTVIRFPANSCWLSLCMHRQTMSSSWSTTGRGYMLTSSHQWMQDDSAETNAKKAQSAPAAPTSEQMGCEVSGTVMFFVGRAPTGGFRLPSLHSFCTQLPNSSCAAVVSISQGRKITYEFSLLIPSAKHLCRDKISRAGVSSVCL